MNAPLHGFSFMVTSIRGRKWSDRQELGYAADIVFSFEYVPSKDAKSALELQYRWPENVAHEVSSLESQLIT